MSENNDIFEKYLDEEKGVAGFFKKSKSWVYIVTALAVVFVCIIAYKSLVVDRMSKQEVLDSMAVVELDSQWVEKEVTNDGVKIVPTVTFKIKNVGRKALRYLNFEGVFMFEETGQTHSDGIAFACKEPLPPGETSEQVFIKSRFGYSASGKQAFMTNKENWKKMDVKIFVNTKGSGPVRIVEKHPVKQVIEGLKGAPQESAAEREQLKKSTERVAKSIEIVAQETKWLDRKVITGKAVIVPSIKITIKNLSAEPLRDIVFKGTFLFDGSDEWLADGLTRALKKPLAGGETSPEILIRAEHGYTASSKRAFIDNRQNWKPVKVKVYVKAQDSGYAFLGVFPVSREIEGVIVRYRMKEK
ncbi:MAG: hypothetical protein KAW12_00965 [Candidatus Aminicenantes bacterium]|nr:hypothetical protein [Candidatus Aminicenantes bacterium]